MLINAHTQNVKWQYVSVHGSFDNKYPYKLKCKPSLNANNKTMKL